MALTAAEAEVQKLRELEDRIKAPCIWGRLPCGIRFEDLQERWYDAAVHLVKKHYLNEEITYRSVKISENKEGVDEFIHNFRTWMKDKMSVAAVKEGEDKLIGILVMRIQEKGIAKELLRAGINQTMSANVPVISGVMTTGRLQQISDELGFVKYNEIFYVRYLLDGKVVFQDAGQGNYGAALMAFRIPEVDEVPEAQKEHQSRFNLKEEED